MIPPYHLWDHPADLVTEGLSPSLLALEGFPVSGGTGCYRLLRSKSSPKIMYWYLDFVMSYIGISLLVSVEEYKRTFITSLLMVSASKDVAVRSSLCWKFVVAPCTSSCIQWSKKPLQCLSLFTCWAYSTMEADSKICQKFGNVYQYPL